jgi:hypothetical protein
VQVAAERNVAGLDSAEQADDHDIRHGAGRIARRPGARPRA